jgi:hypothetical protein
MSSTSGNRRIALGLIVLIGSVVAFHTHLGWKHGIQLQRSTKHHLKATTGATSLKASKGNVVMKIRRHGKERDKNEN